MLYLYLSFLSHLWPVLYYQYDRDLRHWRINFCATNSGVIITVIILQLKNAMATLAL